MKVVAMKEVSEGNETTGTAWIETRIFDADATLYEVLTWAANPRDRTGGELTPENGGRFGRLMLSVPCGEDGR